MMWGSSVSAVVVTEVIVVLDDVGFLCISSGCNREVIVVAG
jgi:hypothetical protein